MITRAAGDTTPPLTQSPGHAQRRVFVPNGHPPNCVWRTHVEGSFGAASPGNQPQTRDPRRLAAYCAKIAAVQSVNEHRVAGMIAVHRHRPARPGAAGPALRGAARRRSTCPPPAARRSPKEATAPLGAVARVGGERHAGSGGHRLARRLLGPGHEGDRVRHRVLLRIDDAEPPPEPVDVDAVGGLEDVRHVVADQHHRHAA